MPKGDRLAICHPEFLEDLQHWVETDRRTARRQLDLMQAILGGQLMAAADSTGFAPQVEAGKLRVEGKEYVVHDGDVMHFRFNV